MPIDRQRYPDNWSDIALSIKEAASWRCRHCGKQCLLPGDNKNDLTRSELQLLHSMCIMLTSPQKTTDQRI